MSETISAKGATWTWRAAMFVYRNLERVRHLVIRSRGLIWVLRPTEYVCPFCGGPAELLRSTDRLHCIESRSYYDGVYLFEIGITREDIAAKATATKERAAYETAMRGEQ